MIVENKPSYYIGTVTYVENDPLGLLTKDKLYHEAVVSVPGVFENVLAFPARTNLDEPKVGDLVVVCSWDPVYNSYCTYEKLKENDFVGFRAHGKMVQINHEKIVVGVFDEGTEYKDDDVPDVSPIAHLEMDKEGNITVHAAKNITVNGDKDCSGMIKALVFIDDIAIVIAGVYVIIGLFFLGGSKTRIGILCFIFAGILSMVILVLQINEGVGDELLYSIFKFIIYLFLTFILWKQYSRI